MKEAYLAGEWISTGKTLNVVNPYDGKLVDSVAQCGTHEINLAIEAAVAALDETRRMEPYQRADALAFIRDSLAQRSDEFARV